jgi:hypothetical protein
VIAIGERQSKSLQGERYSTLPGVHLRHFRPAGRHLRIIGPSIGASGYVFKRGDLVSKATWVETVQAIAGSFRLWIHQEVDRRITGAGKMDVLGVVVSHPVHLPGSEQARSHPLHSVILQREMSRRLFKDDFVHIGGVDWNPSITGQVDFGATMLRLGHVAI